MLEKLGLRPVQPLNTSRCLFGEIMDNPLRGSTVNAVISDRTLRNCVTVVSCQLARLRLLPTAQTVNSGDRDRRKMTAVRPVQNWKAYIEKRVGLLGSVSEVSARQCLKAYCSTAITLSGSAREVRPAQPEKECRSMYVKLSGSVRAVRLLQLLNELDPIFVKA